MKVDLTEVHRCLAALIAAIGAREFAAFELLTFPSLRLVAKVPFAAAPAACSWPTSDPTLDV
jgi:hypothetical protein